MQGLSSFVTHLFHFGQVQGVLVVRPELHEPHVRRLRQLRDALDARKKSGSYVIKRWRIFTIQ